MTAPITVLPPVLPEAAVELWEECGLTRPWNELDRASAGSSSAVLAAVQGGRLLGAATVGHDATRP